MTTTDAELRVLQPGDEPQLFEFLGPYIDSSLFFFSNVEKAGLEYRGEPLQGTYVARYNPAGAITAVVSHCWNGNLMVQGHAGLEQAALHAVAVSGRAVRGIIGPWSLACRVRTVLGLDQTRAAHDDRELLFALAIEHLTPPELLSRKCTGVFQLVFVRPNTTATPRCKQLTWAAPSPPTPSPCRP